MKATDYSPSINAPVNSYGFNIIQCLFQLIR